MCSPAVCPRCRKVTWTGCGMHVDAVMAQVPEDKHCTCRWPAADARQQTLPALTDAGVEVRTSTSVAAITDTPGGRDGAVCVRLSDGTEVPADLVLLSVGVRPESSLARAAGLDLNERGAVNADEHLLTCAPGVYTVGDAIEVVDAVTGAPAIVPLAGPANRQGRAAADHLFGRAGTDRTGRERAGRTPVLGTAIVRVFDTVAATTGRPERALRAAGIPHHAVHLHPGHHAGYFPGARPLHLKVVFAPDGRILGAQATGSEGVDKRIDVIATAIRAGMTVQDLAELELAYAPPFGSAKDPVNQLGYVADNIMTGTTHTIGWDEIDGTDRFVVDVRTAGEHRRGHIPGSVNISVDDLRERHWEIPRDANGAPVPVAVYCQVGQRGHTAARLLTQLGYDVVNLDGGWLTYSLARAA